MNPNKLEVTNQEESKEKGIVRSTNVVYPEYWKKRKNRLSNEFLKNLEKTAKSEIVESDQYGEYRVGTFLHRDCVVEVRRDNGLWSVYILSEHPIGLYIIEEIRYKYIPDNVVMAQLYGSRVNHNKMKGILLYEIPTNDDDEPDNVELSESE